MKGSSAGLLFQILVAAVLSGVYIIYLPHASPVLDDWAYFRAFHDAQTGGVTSRLAFVGQIADNTWTQQFRVFWASFVALYGLFQLAGFSGWPYFLFAWTAHLLTIVLLWRLIAGLAGEAMGFAAAAIYAVLPTSNSALFWPGNCVMYLETLCLIGWLYWIWQRHGVRRDFHYGWRDFLAFALVIFSGEQISLALVLLLPITQWCFGEREDRKLMMRFWLIHACAAASLFILYAVVVNAMPVLAGLRRFQAHPPWHPWPFIARVLGTLGVPGLVEWPFSWRVDLALACVLVLVGGVLLLAVRRSGDVSAGRGAKLLLWALAGLTLTYLPVSLLAIEYRYLYVPSPFLAAGAAALLGLVSGRIRLVLTLAVMAHCLAVTYWEMRAAGFRRAAWRGLRSKRSLTSVTSTPAT